MNKNNGFTVIAAVLFVFVAIGVGGGYAYYKYPNIVSSKVKSVLTLGAPEDKDTYIAASLEKLSRTTSFKVSGENTVRELETETQKPNGASVSSDAAVKWNGAFDLVTMSLDLTFTLDAPKYQLGFEAKKIGESLYVRATNVSKDFPFLTDQWVVLDLASAGKQYHQEKAAERIREFDHPKVKDLFGKAVKYKVFKAIEEFPEEDVAAIPTRHFRMGFDRLALEKLIKEMSGELDSSEEAQLQEALDTIDSSVVEIWIGKKDHMPRKITTRSVQMDGQVPTAEIFATVMFSEFNERFDIVPPSDAIPLEDFLRASLQKALPAGTQINIKK